MSENKSIKSNFIFNWLNTILGIIFPIVTFPYVAKIIGPVGLGIISFDTSIIKYISVLSSLGIGFYAVREVSRYKGNRIQQNHCTVEILLLHVLLTFFGYIAVLLLYFFVPKINSHGAVFLILSLSLFFNVIGVLWFFQAQEDFKFLTTRALSVKFVMAIALFVFVRNSNDLLWYAWILAMSDIANNTINFIRLRRYISLSEINWKGLKIFSHLKSIFIIFAMSLIMYMYVDFPLVFLGFDSGDVQVGYYSTSTRLVAVVLSFVTALGASMLPRMSSLYANGEVTKFRELEHKAMSFSIGVTLPISIAFIIIAPEVILCFSSDEFIPSISVMRIVAPVILFIAIAGIVGFQTLYPQGREIDIVKSTIVGFVVSVILNITLIPRLLQDGAAIAYLSTELSVTISMIYFGRRYLTYNYLNISVFKYILSTAVMVIPVALIHNYVHVSIYIKLIIETIVGISFYAAMLYITRENLFIELFYSVKYKISHQ